MFSIGSVSSYNHKFSRLLFISNLILFGLVNPALAQTRVNKIREVNSDYGLPTHRRDGGSRTNANSCLANRDSRNLIALIPENTVGINASTSPQLFFYVPKVNRDKTLEFVLRNEQDELMYEAFLTTEGDGIISVEIPSDIQANKLENQQNYHWYLSMICNEKQRSRDIVVEGWMRHEALDLATKQQLNTANSLKKAELYNQKGFWYDAVAMLVQTQNSNPKQPLVKAKWSALLNSVGLKELESEPFVESELIEISEGSELSK